MRVSDKRLVAVIVALIVIGFAVAVVASSMGGGASAGHAMPDGSTMQGEQMP